LEQNWSKWSRLPDRSNVVELKSKLKQVVHGNLEIYHCHTHRQRKPSEGHQPWQLLRSGSAAAMVGGINISLSGVGSLGLKAEALQVATASWRLAVGWPVLWSSL
jgi:hypothetical protein